MKRVLAASRRTVEAAVGVVIGLAFVATWQAQSFVVCGPSMAETLVAVHRELMCHDCGIHFRCAAEEAVMLGKRAVCPNCGCRGQRLDAAATLAADGVLVDKTAFLFRPPRRWELAAFRAPNRASQLYVKRVVGLPGERIELRHGDVYADGAICRKTLVELRRRAVTVHDANHEPASSPSRWTSDNADSQWRASGGRFWHPGTRDLAGDDLPIDWLTYHHRRYQPGTVELSEQPIVDECGYNQTRPLPELRPVRDLMVRCRLRISGGGRVVWMMTDGQSQFRVELNAGTGENGQNAMRVRGPAEDGLPRPSGLTLDGLGRPSADGIIVNQDGRLLGRFPLPAALPDDGVSCEVALCDRQVLLALDGKEVVTASYGPADVPLRPTSRPVAVGTRGDVVEIRELVLLRDVDYWSVRTAVRQAAEDRLGDDEYFVLGDNSPDSLDSRHWPLGIPIGDFVGKPLLAYPAGLGADGRGRQFEVPDWGRFRYIQ